MTRDEFRQAKVQIRVDIERELQLARFNRPASASTTNGGTPRATGFTGSSSGHPLGSVAAPACASAVEASSLDLRIHSGAGNFLAALALLCYTEWAGKTEFMKKRHGRDDASGNFNAFFPLLGAPYEARGANPYVMILGKLDVYGKLRCGLAHEYFAKSPITIHMLADHTWRDAVTVDSTSHVTFVVETFFADLMAALDALEKRKTW
jgi:hypothetical protein